MLRTTTVSNVTKQAYQSVKTAPASWTQSLHKTYTSILDSTMPRFMPERAPAGPALAQQTVRETLQNVKQQAMQMITPIYNPKVKRYQDPETGRFVANPNVERVEKPVGVEKKGKEVERVRNVESVQGVSKGTGNNSQIEFTRGFDVDPKYSSYEQRVKTTPLNKGEWSNERAESLFISDKTGEIKKYLDEAGVDGVEYKNGMPDFSPFSKGEIKLENMTNDRKSNFSTADEELAKKWSTPEQKWTAEDIADWREDNKYTWHELNDLETIQLVPSKINSVFKHLGGVGEYNIKVKLGE
ncbi:HNH endonuclease [Priestia flexa]|uniref:HNH endonuclease n=1 Tax=Priestia flexa TaxID=86664 RepID=UPI00240E43B0|nr:HNH endonuclease [Priestia flexa]WEZ06990.1 HNH endonuclease [Priestia flexa]